MVGERGRERGGVEERERGESQRGGGGARAILTCYEVLDGSYQWLPVPRSHQI